MGNGKLGAKNLVPTNQRTKEEQRKIAVMGGIASGKVRREKKLWRDIAEELGEMKISNVKQRNNIKAFFGELNGDITHDAAIIASAYVQAYQGNVQAMKFLAELKGEIVEQKNIKLDADVKADVDVSTLPDKILFDIADKLQGIEPD
jgi:ubiquinone biosynthesis protein UbiJ